MTSPSKTTILKAKPAIIAGKIILRKGTSAMNNKKFAILLALLTSSVGQTKTISIPALNRGERGAAALSSASDIASTAWNRKSELFSAFTKGVKLVIWNPLTYGALASHSRYKSVTDRNAYIKQFNKFISDYTKRQLHHLEDFDAFEQLYPVVEFSSDRAKNFFYDLASYSFRGKTIIARTRQDKPNSHPFGGYLHLLTDAAVETDNNTVIIFLSPAMQEAIEFVSDYLIEHETGLSEEGLVKFFMVQTCIETQKLKASWKSNSGFITNPLIASGLVLATKRTYDHLKSSDYNHARALAVTAAVVGASATVATLYYGGQKTASQFEAQAIVNVAKKMQPDDLNMIKNSSLTPAHIKAVLENM